jgi:nucleotide-binding universal stress UspA family protein
VEHIISNEFPSASFDNRIETARTPNILLCLDRSELSETILSYAVMLTRALSGSLTLMHVVESSCDINSNSHDALMWELKQHEAHQYMDQIMGRIDRLKISTKLKIEQGKAAEQILGYIRQHPVDYVILASHGKHGLAEWSLSSTAAKIIGRTHSSFIVVPATPIYQHAKLEPSIQRILVPLDDSLSSQAALPIAIRIARQQNADLVLAHAIEPVSFNRFPGMPHADRETINAANSILESAARNYFEQISLRLQNEGLKVSVIVRPSPNPIALITEIIASMNIDFIVMSAHGSSRNEEYPLAPNSAHMTSHTPVPLLIEQDLDKEQISKALRKRRFDRAPLRCSKMTADDTS